MKFTAALVIEPKCLPTDGRIDKMWYVHTVERYLAMERNEAVIHVTTWMTLDNITDNITLRERSQSQKGM